MSKADSGEAKADSSEALVYARDFKKEILDWYKNADLKAQVILTLDGVFLAFLTSSIFTKPEEASKFIDEFTTPIWLLLSAMCTCLAASIVSALFCLWSRILWPWKLTELQKKWEIQPSKGETYPPQALGFFQLISRLPEDQFRERLKTVDHKDEMAILAFQIRGTSENVTKKHRWVNGGFLFAALSLILFLFAGVLYAWHLYN
jgi:hypothetical protein